MRQSFGSFWGFRCLVRLGYRSRGGRGALLGVGSSRRRFRRRVLRLVLDEHELPDQDQGKRDNQNQRHPALPPPPPGSCCGLRYSGKLVRSLSTNEISFRSARGFCEVPSQGTTFSRADKQLLLVYARERTSVREGALTTIATATKPTGLKPTQLTRSLGMTEVVP